MYEISTLGQEVRVHRELLGFSQEEFADRLDVARTTLSSWERNASLPSPKHIRVLIKSGALTLARARELIARAHSGYPVGKYSYELEIVPPKSLLNEGARFGALYVRPGPLHTLWTREPQNLEFAFEGRPTEGRGILVLHFRRPDNLGFQFKCFVDFDLGNWKHIKREMESRGFKCDPHPAHGQLRRLWFLLPDYPTVKTPEGLEDNFYMPS